MPAEQQAIMVPAPEVPAIPPTPPAQPTPPAGTPPATPPATPPQAPATPPANPPAGDPPIQFTDPPPAAPTPPQDATVVYEKTGDAGLDVALAYVGQRGFGPEHPAMQAAMKGDFAALEQALKGLGDKAKDAALYINLAKESHARQQASVKAQGEAAAKIVYEAVGGKEQWAAIQAWAAEHADADEKKQLNAAFKAGGVAAASAAQYLAGLYAKHGKTSPKAAVKADAVAATPLAVGALSPREYGLEVQKLAAKLGARMEESREYADLKARRAAYRA